MSSIPFYVQTQKYGARKLPNKLAYYAVEKMREQLGTTNCSDLEEQTKYEVLTAVHDENQLSYGFELLGCEQSTMMRMQTQNGIVFSQRNDIHSDSVVVKFFVVGSLESDMDSQVTVRLSDGEEHKLQYGEIIMIPGFYSFDVLSNKQSVDLITVTIVGGAFK